MKKQFWIAFLLIFIGLAGILICFVTQNSHDRGEKYSREWKITAAQAKKIHIASNKTVDLRIKKSTDNRISIRIEGKLSKSENKAINRIQPESNQFNLSIGTNYTWLEKWHRPNYGIQKITLFIPQESVLGEVKLDFQDGNIYFDQIKGKSLDLALKSGKIMGNESKFTTTKIDTNRASTELTNWDGTLLLISNKGDQFVRDSRGNFTFQNQTGMTQVHRHTSEKGEILNLTGKIVSTESAIDAFTINSAKGTDVIEGLKGDLLLSTIEGDSILRDNRGSQVIRSEKGIVIINQVHLAEKLDIKTKTGLIKLTLTDVYKDMPIAIEASHGQVSSDFHWETTQKNPRIKIQTEHGEVKVIQEN
ncbi:hypothetical protein MFLO_03068 [Listeria floridensis FSL S10-1187]|uniref:DUF4097 domain-containing protein n=1 Tax=Listeria floridensis FSL S10-1187 TaxID=1265817 RepID=A0ABP3B0S7_9LIST|nr:DUF4097 family beta strand repeat-containing protein [Listeria floridensis]EUJ33490.1 hypothetical protein MFLO_03068 [Listeria floridensis FSL S10-1187]